MKTSASYLNSLSHDQAISFRSSLQTICDHLTRELEWMTQQIQQKTAYLESIQALLAEANALEGTTPEPTPATDEAISQESIAAAIAELSALPISDAVNTTQTQEEMGASNGNLPSKPESSSKGDPTKPTPSKTQSKGKSVPATKTNTSPAKKPTPKTPPAKKLELRESLLPKFKGNALTRISHQSF